ncbi:MAG: amidohydrolase [Magnetococcales bacterium]|nr:amidohydrolase [Magnetococcales bacterium]NGZ04869.1 amidohydrolase [Magnetococcales bacterium]
MTADRNGSSSAQPGGTIPLRSVVWDRFWNPCLSGLPTWLANHPLVQAAWEGVDPHHCWDMHVHLGGIGDGESGIRIAPAMQSLWHPWPRLQMVFYKNGAGVSTAPPGQVDARYVERLLALVNELPDGFKLLLLAMDQAHDHHGSPLPERTACHIPNGYVRQLAQSFPQRLAWAASIHPYRADACAALEEARAEGAVAIKWLPPAMGIDPADARCLPFYRTLARLDLPLLTHAGAEQALHGTRQPRWGNPLRLRLALESGVRVIVAHCASLGKDEDLDHGGQPVTSFQLFARLLDHPDYHGRLYGDLSAITQRNRRLELLRTLLERTDWHDRLLNGSDYPLPGIPLLIDPASLARAGLLDDDCVPLLRALRGYHPLLFDFVLKRHLRFGSYRWPARIFETRSFFDRSAAA